MKREDYQVRKNHDSPDFLLLCGNESYTTYMSGMRGREREREGDR